MTAFALGMPRRGVAGCLGFVVALPAAAASASPDTRLEGILASLEDAERRFRELPDDDSGADGLIAEMGPAHAARRSHDQGEDALARSD